MGRLLGQLGLSLLKEVPALTCGLRRDARSLLPGDLGYVLSRLNAAATQARGLILDNVGRVLLLRHPGRRRLAALYCFWQVVVCHMSLLLDQATCGPSARQAGRS